jgi:hypothetical protein
MVMLLTAEELLAGTELAYDIEIPAAVLNPTADGEPDAGGSGRHVRIRPLTVRDVQLIAKAARDDEVLTSVLMIQRAVVEPELKEKEIGAMPSGLVRFLVDGINRVSGLSAAEDELRDWAASPLVQAFFVLAREFGWTPEQVRGLTVGQVLSYLEMLNHARRTG